MLCYRHDGQRQMNFNVNINTTATDVTDDNILEFMECLKSGKPFIGLNFNMASPTNEFIANVELKLKLDHDTSTKLKRCLFKAQKFLSDAGAILDNFNSGMTSDANLLICFKWDTIPTRDAMTTTIWRVINTAIWCTLPNRPKLGPTHFRQVTWDKISLDIDPNAIHPNEI
jgi:hypothetical protein